MEISISAKKYPMYNDIIRIVFRLMCSGFTNFLLHKCIRLPTTRLLLAVIYVEPESFFCDVFLLSQGLIKIKHLVNIKWTGKTWHPV